MERSEAVLEGEPITDDKRTPKGRKVLMFWLHVITFALGVGLLVLLVWYIGWKTILESLRTVGWGFVPVILLNLLRHFLRSASMYLAVPKEERNFKYMSAVAASIPGAT